VVVFQDLDELSALRIKALSDLIGAPSHVWPLCSGRQAKPGSLVRGTESGLRPCAVTPPSPRLDPATRPCADGGLDADAGSAEQGPEQLRHALWTAHQLLDSSAKADKRVLIFTCDANPPGTGVAAAEFRCAPARMGRHGVAGLAAGCAAEGVHAGGRGMHVLWASYAGAPSTFHLHAYNCA
jgi:hypothetical protein